MHPHQRGINMLDSWTPEATVTVGGVLASIVGLLILIVRKMGARTDPELLKLTNRQLGLFESLEKNLERHSQILTTLTETITRHSESDAQRSVQITQALNLVIEKARGEHEEMKQTLGAVLQAATEGHSIVNETRVIAGDIMDKLPRLDQTDLLKQIADKLDTVLKNIELMRGEFTQR